MTRPTDVLLHGSVFYDDVFVGLRSAPSPGTEVWAGRRGVAPGGVANIAVACARLGLLTRIACDFGDDLPGRWCRDVLRAEGVDLGSSPVHRGWPTPTTMSWNWSGDRAMITYGEPAPVPPADAVAPAPSRALFTWLDVEPGWRGSLVTEAVAAGTEVFVDAGWDETGAWDRARLRQLSGCAAFLPNAGEAMAYARCGDVAAAAAALAEYVPLVVVTDGPRGVYAVDSSSVVAVHCPALDVPACDTTGAGDCFSAGFIFASLAHWALAERLSFATLCAALSVQELTGSLGSPGWAEIATWWAGARGDRDLRDRYDFLDRALPDTLPPEATRAPTSPRWPLPTADPRRLTR